MLDVLAEVWFMGLKYCQNCGAIAWVPLPKEQGVLFYKTLRCAHCHTDLAEVLIYARNFKNKALVELQREWEMTTPAFRDVTTFDAHEVRL